jgi:pyridoxal phosphate enzyme (YggS family)
VGLPVRAVCAALHDRQIAAFPFDIALRAAQVREAIATASIGRTAPTLVAVSKGQPVEKLQEAVRLGLVPLGESYVQEWKAKIAAFGDAQPSWHFIGRVQRNKAKFIGAHADLVHAVDALRTGEALAQGARDAGRIVPILVQINPTGETSKGGVPPKETAALVQALDAIDGLTVRGLMTIPPLGESARPHFATVRALADTLGLPVRSMGMSADFADAIAEGATHVRVGTALFGPRGK